MIHPSHHPGTEVCPGVDLAVAPGGHVLDGGRCSAAATDVGSKDIAVLGLQVVAPDVSVSPESHQGGTGEVRLVQLGDPDSAGLAVLPGHVTVLPADRTGLAGLEVESPNGLILLIEELSVVALIGPPAAVEFTRPLPGGSVEQGRVRFSGGGVAGGDEVAEGGQFGEEVSTVGQSRWQWQFGQLDRKSTRLNSSHVAASSARFSC